MGIVGPLFRCLKFVYYLLSDEPLAVKSVRESMSRRWSQRSGWLCEEGGVDHQPKDQPILCTAEAERADARRACSDYASRGL